MNLFSMMRSAWPQRFIAALPNAAGHVCLCPEELTKLSLPPPRLRVRPCCQAPLECRHWLPWLRSRKPDVGEKDLAGGLADLRVHPLARRQSRAAEPVLRCLFDTELQLGRDFVGLLAVDRVLPWQQPPLESEVQTRPPPARAPSSPASPLDTRFGGRACQCQW